MTDEELEQLVADAKKWLEQQRELPFDKKHFLRNLQALVDEIRRLRSETGKADFQQYSKPDGN